MQIYEGSPRQDWEEVLRCVGAYLDDRAMRGVVFVQADNGFIVQGLAVENTSAAYGDTFGSSHSETLQISDDDVARFMDEALARRGGTPDPTPKHYESQLRVLGRYIDERKPHDIFFFEIDGAYIIRLSIKGQVGIKHELVEFTADDVAGLIANAPTLRRGSPAKPSAT